MVCRTQWPLILAYLLGYLVMTLLIFTDYFYMWHKYNPWGDDVSRTISRSIGKKSRSHGSFEFLRSGWRYPSRSLIYNFLLVWIFLIYLNHDSSCNNCIRIRFYPKWFSTVAHILCLKRNHRGSFTVHFGNKICYYYDNHRNYTNCLLL